MRAHTFARVVGLMLAAWGSTAAAGDIIVICHTSVSLQAGEVRDVYFGDKSFAGAVKLAPADNSAIQAEFLEKVMKLDAKKYAGVWIKKAFRDGSAPPPVKTGDAEAIAYVKQTAGACSYVASPPGDGVVIVAKF
ncbi:MAG TPA: hypothetical protein VGL34_12125 [Steroidobacteraceae bacterium]|jgi:hypothetical protein